MPCRDVVALDDHAARLHVAFQPTAANAYCMPSDELEDIGFNRLEEVADDRIKQTSPSVRLGNAWGGADRNSEGKRRKIRSITPASQWARRFLRGEVPREDAVALDQKGC